MWSLLSNSCYHENKVRAQPARVHTKLGARRIVLVVVITFDNILAKWGTNTVFNVLTVTYSTHASVIFAAIFVREIPNRLCLRSAKTLLGHRITLDIWLFPVQYKPTNDRTQWSGCAGRHIFLFLFFVFLFLFLYIFFCFFFRLHFHFGCPSSRRLQGIEDRAEEGAEILEHFEFDPEDESQMDNHQLVKYVQTVR